MQMSNRTLMTFFTAIWLDTLALCGPPSPKSTCRQCRLERLTGQGPWEMIWCRQADKSTM